MIETARHGDVLEIMMNHPPVNALGWEVRRDLIAAFDAAEADPAVRAIVLRGSGGLFSGGADIREFGNFRAPDLPTLVERIEACCKPVIAAIHGNCLGGGLEVALACHYRVATGLAKLGLPEVKLGILPGAGGTQRLPRLIGQGPAVEMVALGAPVSAACALELSLVDHMTSETDLIEEAIAFAATVDAPRRTGASACVADPHAIEAFVAKQGKRIAGLDAPKACIEAVEAAAALPIAAGLERERALFRSLVEGEQSRGLRHAFFAERAAAKIDGLAADLPLRSIRHVGIIGAGTMGGGIAMSFLSAGIAVTIVDMTHEALDRGVSVIRCNYEATAAKGRLSSQQVEKVMALLTPTIALEDLANCDLTIEAVYEDMDVKKEMFRRLDAIVKPGAILASNTSFLDINEIGAVTARPGDVLGLHFFSPANVMRLLEVVRGKTTAPDVLATAMGLARRIGKVAVVSGVCYGFIGNRILTPRHDQADALILEGASPDQIDRVHTGFGMPMGPFQMADLAGLDIGWHRDPHRVENVREGLCAAGRWGQKCNAGYYDYDEQRRPTPSPITADIIERFRQQVGVTPRTIHEREIIVRTLYVMINEGAKILEEGIAQRASDIDVVYLAGYGWPAVTGGPMFWADCIGLDKIVTALEEYRPLLGPDFTLSKLLVSLARKHGTFAVHSAQAS